MNINHIPKSNHSQRYNKFTSYIFGWRDGAGGSPLDSKQFEVTDIILYEKGHKDGRLARGSMINKMAKKYKINLSPLREY